ncbi:MAG TPA: hypothetical protein VK201_04475, partial [bacterium]|nr:hypothetical protein [bacterium]
MLQAGGIDIPFCGRGRWGRTQPFKPVWPFCQKECYMGRHESDGIMREEAQAVIIGGGVAGC